jgi:hypothetical protein
MNNSLGVQKGYTSILTERGIFKNNVGLPYLDVQCKPCKTKQSWEERTIEGGDVAEFVYPQNYCDEALRGQPYTGDLSGWKCCARNILSHQPDFMEQKSWLEEVVHAAGFKLIFYPKYHCELNFIEMVWGFVKALHRRRCTYNYAHLKQGLPNTLESMPLRSIRKFHRKTMRYMSAYRLDFTGPLLEYAVKKFTSHRAVPSGQKDAIAREFEVAESKRRRSKNI